MAFGLIISPFWTVFVAEQQYIFLDLDLDGKLRTKTTAQVKSKHSSFIQLSKFFSTLPKY